jgi:hypothetical protein
MHQASGDQVDTPVVRNNMDIQLQKDNMWLHCISLWSTEMSK